MTQTAFYSLQKCRHNGNQYVLGAGKLWAVVTPEGEIYESRGIPAVYRRKTAAEQEVFLLNVKIAYLQKKGA